MKTALGYIRISKDEPNSVSLDYQKSELERYCQRERLELVGIESDEGISGKSITNRSGVQRVLQAVDERVIDAVIVYKSDRMSRDGIESLQIEKLFLKRGVEYFSVTEGSLTSDSVDDEFMRFIRAGLNQRERKLVGLRTRQALKRKKERGEKTGGHVPFGMRLADDGIHLEPDEHEQSIIATIRRLRAKEHSYGAIARELNALGIKTKTGCEWTHKQVSRLVSGVAHAA